MNRNDRGHKNDTWLGWKWNKVFRKSFQFSFICLTTKDVFQIQRNHCLNKNIQFQFHFQQNPYLLHRIIIIRNLHCLPHNNSSFKI